MEIDEIDLHSPRSKTSTESVITYRGSTSLLYSAICPLVYAFRIFGVAPYEFVNDALLPSSVNSVFTFIWFCIYMYLSYYVAGMYYYDYDPTQPFSVTLTETSKTFFNFVVAFHNIIVCFSTRKKFTNVWNTIQNYDEEMQKMGYARSERKTSIFVWSTLITSFVIWTTINRAGMYAFLQSWRDNMAYMIVYVGTSVSIVKFSGIVLLLGQRFNHLNEIVLRSIPLKARLLDVIPVVDTKTVEKLYDSLMTASESLASIYSISLLCWIGCLSLNSIFDVYFVISWILNRHAEWPLMFCMMAWIVGFLSQLFLLVNACHYTANEARAMGYIMLSWKRWLYTRNRGLIVETSMHLKIRKLNFSAGDCFDVNLPLLRTIAATMTTYLVILLQFQ